MGSDDTSLTQSTVQKLEEGLLEKRLGGALGVGAVGDDHVELVLLLLEVFEAIANVLLDVRVLEANAHAWEVFLGHADDSLARVNLSHFYVQSKMLYLVNVAKSGLLDGRVLDDLAENTTVTTADNKDLLRVRVGVHGQVGDHFLVPGDQLEMVAMR